MPDLSRRAAALPLTLVRIAVLVALLPCAAHGQSAKEINEQTQFWWSINTTSRITDRFGAVADFHIRRNNFVADPSFYFLRFGSNIWLTDRFTLTFGYAHMWKAPASEDGQTWTNENRIYQQAQYVTKLGGTTMLQRFRNEQRWQQQAQDDVLTGETTFSDRVRYLLSFTVPFSKKPSVPSLVFSDEILVQFGPDITLNTFDQNRFFAGIKKNLNPSWSFDFGYMVVYQQKSSGYQYDLNNTIRWFFYYYPDFRKNKKGTHEPASNEE